MEGLVWKSDTFNTPFGGDNHVLIGTTILPNTNSQMAAYHYGYRLIKLEKSDCQGGGEEVYWLKDKINSLEQGDSLLVVDLSLYDNCCFDFLVDYGIDSSGVLNLKYQGYGDRCACNCCFGLVCTFERQSYLEDAPPIKAVILNGDLESKRPLR